MTRGKLTLRIRDWGDGTAELRAHASADQFSGEASANFNLAALIERANLFAKFPLPAGETVAFSGGFWSRTNPNELVGEHVYIGVTQGDRTGRILMEVRLAKPYEDDELHKGRCSRVVVEFSLEYQQLQVFADQLTQLAKGQRDAVVLEVLNPS